MLLATSFESPWSRECDAQSAVSVLLYTRKRNRKQHNDAIGDANELQNCAQTRERNLLFKSYVYAPFEVLREKCSSPVLECQKIYSNRTKQFRHCAFENDHLFLLGFLGKIAFERYQTILENCMQCSRIMISVLIIDFIARDILYLLMIYFSLNILNRRWYNSIEHRQKTKPWSMLNGLIKNKKNFKNFFFRKTSRRKSSDYLIAA